MTVWICQCLCPERHCIACAAGECDSEATADETVREPLMRVTRRLLKRGAFNPWCATCDADEATWRYELRRTSFATMAEALPHFQALEAAINAAQTHAVLARGRSSTLH